MGIIIVLQIAKKRSYILWVGKRFNDSGNFYFICGRHSGKEIKKKGWFKICHSVKGFDAFAWVLNALAILSCADTA